MKLEADPGFDWHAVQWARPEDEMDRACSYCTKQMGDEEVALILWGQGSGNVAKFCEACQTKHWGVNWAATEASS